ncbi:uncharacterized protein LOC130891144 isoform X1 [Diorhabda carinulata]|uniref:uncharacterized protein LOC130891144 isoform X1 n=1 Tax=Diorhabda carinulata TaxID=1163345 RepID=UPI0025A2ED21|nr:uncharacterized protein LOC130891144 isoform X1 [Diorhabda carinulata]
MVRGRGYSSRGYRGSRGNPSWNGSSSRGEYSSKYNSFDSRSPYDSKPKYSSSERFSRNDDYRPYRSEYSSMDRDRRSPDRKRIRIDAPSSRHDSYYGSSSRRDPPSYSDRRALSVERHSSSLFPRRDEVHRSSPPKRGSYRGRLSSRGSRGLRGRDRAMKRRLLESSYTIRRRIPRISDYSRKLKIARIRSSINARRGAIRGTKIKEESGNENNEETEKAEDSENKVKDEKEAEGDEKKKRSSKAFIKLQCPHCHMKALTFRRYEAHLLTRTHIIAMKKIAYKQKAILAQMRLAQRNTQNELEKNNTEELAVKTSYCPLCKLNYKQKKSVHQETDAHKNMKKFLMPFCKVCNIAFKSPMVYEAHCCSVDHIKRKQRMEDSDVTGEEDNLENFTTIDSVGDLEGEASGNEEKKDDDAQPANVGIEKIHKIEAYYCELCKMYLQRGEESDTPKILSRHCKQRVHMSRYMREEKRIKEEPKEETALEDSKKEDDESKDDKLWADVDKDLGDILAEAETGNKSSDEDEDSHVNGERYDRFKLSEKTEEEKIMGVDEEGILDKLVINDTANKK